MHWIYLIVAGLLEVGFALSLKASDGFSRPIPTVITIVLMIVSFGLLSIAMKSLPVGTAYAVWTGIGAVGTAIIGMVFLGESKEWPRVACIALIAMGIVGLKLFTPTDVPETSSIEAPIDAPQ